MLRPLLILSGVALFAAVPGSAQPSTRSDGPPVLRLEALLDTLADRNLRLQASAASAAAAAAQVPEASTLPDPTLQLGVMNVGLPNFNADMPASMAPSVQLMQRVPFPGKLGLQGDIADAGRRMAEAGAGETWWIVRQQAADLFYDLYSLDGRLAVMRETLGLLENFRTVARAMYAAGGSPQSDALRADVEVVRLEGELHTMEARRRAAAARLNGLLDRPADTPVLPPEFGPLPAAVPAADTLEAWAWESRPLLEQGRVALARAGSNIDLAHRQIWPDLTFGLTYGQRDRGTGTERMGSAVVGFSLPVHAGRRQYAAREEAEALRQMADAELSGARIEVEARIGVLLAELESAQTLISLYRDDILPEARATVESAFSSYRVGAVDFMTLVDAQMAANRFETDLVGLFADYGRAVAGLESSVGRTLPSTGQTLTAPSEDR